MGPLLEPGETEKGAPYAYEQLDRLDDESHPFAVSIAHRSVAVSEMTLGDFVSAAAHAESACEVILSSDDGQTASRFGHDLNISAHMMCAMILAFRGHVDDAIAMAGAALASARWLGHSATLGYVVFFTGVLQLICRRRLLDEREIEEFFGTSDRLPILADNAPHILGGMRALEGGFAEAVDLVRSMPDTDERPTSVPYADIAFQTVHAETLLRLCYIEKAEAGMVEIFRIIQATGFEWWSADCRRVQGDIRHEGGRTDKAEAHYRAALDIAEGQGARLFALRAALGLARLRVGDAEAISILRSAIDAMPASDRSPDLVEATAFLARLG